MFLLDNVILYLKDPKDSTRKLSDLVNTFSEVVGYKINIKKPKTMVNMVRKKSVKQSPLKTASKNKFRNKQMMLLYRLFICDLIIFFFFF
jgi:hypothetical protein